MQIYDSVIVGGGAAGITAAIYLARYNRISLIVDMGHGRMNNHEINENYFGFHKGIAVTKLKDLGRKQAARFGAKYVEDKIIKIKNSNNYFELKGNKDEFFGKTVIYATGVTDLWPEFEEKDDYIGRSLFWCITCDGHKTIGKKVLVVGNDDGAACTAMQFLNFTKWVNIVTNNKNHEFSPLWLDRLNKAKINIYRGEIKKYNGTGGYFHDIYLSDNTKIELDIMINQQGAIPNSDLAKEIGVKVNEKGYIITDHEKRTNINNFYAAGDVTSLHSHQVVVAAAEGAIAGESANYDLYRPEQRF